jgi:hypothetical protein
MIAFGDEIHIAAQTTEASTIASLRQLSILFRAVVSRSLYGTNPTADHVIRRLLLFSLRRCEFLRLAQIQAAQPVRSKVGWLSSASAFETADHLELYRNFCNHIIAIHNHHHHQMPLEDSSLESATQILQRLCPRINNLSLWPCKRVAGPPMTRVRGVDKSRPVRGSKSKTTTKPARPQRTVKLAFLPTPPPTQICGDTVLTDTLAPPSTQPIRAPQAAQVVHKPEAACKPRAVGYPTPEATVENYDRMVELRQMGEANGWVEEPTQLLEPRLAHASDPAAAVVALNGERRAMPSRVTTQVPLVVEEDRVAWAAKAAGSVVVDDSDSDGDSGSLSNSARGLFRLRPEHGPSERCCPGWTGDGARRRSASRSLPNGTGSSWRTSYG